MTIVGTGREARLGRDDPLGSGTLKKFCSYTKEGLRVRDRREYVGSEVEEDVDLDLVCLVCFDFVFTLGADARMVAGETEIGVEGDNVAGAMGVGSTLGADAGAGAGESWDGAGAGSETGEARRRRQAI